MTFPFINHIDDVLLSIAGRGEFVHAQRNGYSVIDYNYVLPDSFDDPIRLECRGIKFGPDGRVIARPLHKFLNIGEKPHIQPHLLDFSQPHVVTEKLDGSMIHPAVINGEVVFMTRMGRTDVARKAERLLTPTLADECRVELDAGVTPIFEFTAPDNRIVIKYDEPQLSLLAMRWTRGGGEYLDPSYCSAVAHSMGVPFVTHHPSDWNSGQAFLDYARAVSGREGFVVRFDSGLWVKAKGDDYVLKHRAKDSITQEKNVLALVLNSGLDDVIPLLDPADALEIEEYRVRVLMGASATAEQILDHVQSGSALDQKTFATQHQLRIAPELRPLAFQVRSGLDAHQAVTTYLLKNTGSQTSVDASRHLHGAAWPL